MCRSTKGSSIFFDYIKCTKNKKDIVCFQQKSKKAIEKKVEYRYILLMKVVLQK